MRISLLLWSFAALLLAGCSKPAPKPVEGLQFLAFGDVPYSAKDYALLENPKLSDPNIPFAVFYGDMKSGGAKCDAALYAKNARAIFGVLNKPTFAALGDNGWTDCDRFGDDETAKLSELRAAMYAPEFLPVAQNAQDDWHYRSMANYPENMSWRYGGIQFSTLHIVGTNNGRTEINCHISTDRQIMERAALDLVDARDRANLEWLEGVFDEAEATDGDAVVLVMQADPYGDRNARKYVYASDYKTKCTYDRGAPKYTRSELDSLPPCDGVNRVKCDPYKNFLSALERRAKSFGKPVLVIHGSTYDVCVQRGFLGLDAMTRLNGPGDGISDLALVSAQQSENGLIFDFRLNGQGSKITQACS